MVVSQIWVQHLQCTQIIGHCYLRGGSTMEPELGGLLYTALVVALADIEQSHKYLMSGVYGYKIPEIEGIGLFTIQNDYFRIFFLCEGLYGRGIPYLAGKGISSKINKLFNRLETLTPVDTCKSVHQAEEGSFWFSMMCSLGFGGQVTIKEMERVYPLRYVQIAVNRQNTHDINVVRLESAELGTLGYGFQDKLKIVSSKIEGIYGKPQSSFLVYEALFKQIKEFIPDFEPNTIILTYQKTTILEPSNALVAFLSLSRSDELTIRYCIPVPEGLSIEGDRFTHSYLQSLLFDPLEA
ncbi:MAG: hypothetical protein ACXAC8_08255 [Candidatus Hodarchaeales archaeon]